MDRITASMVDAFSAENGIQSLPESDRFEHFASYSTVRSLFDESFDTGNIVLGDQATGIDAIAIIVNDVMIGDLDEFVEINEKAAGLDVTFCFVQADTSKSFDIGKMGNFAFAVRDFSKIPLNSRVQKTSLTEQKFRQPFIRLVQSLRRRTRVCIYFTSQQDNSLETKHWKRGGRLK